MEEQRVAALVHGAEGFIVGQLRLAHKVGEVRDLAVAPGEDERIQIAMLVALCQIVRGPVVVDRLPIFLGHHAADRLKRRDGDAARFGLEEVVGDGVELARRAPVVRPVRTHARAIGRIRPIDSCRVHLGEQRAQIGVDLRRRVAFVARAPQKNRRMVAVAQNLVAHVGDVGGNIGGVGAVERIGLEKFVPHQQSVLVAQLVEILAGALAHPVANQIEVGQLVQANLGVEPLAWNAFHRLVQSPIAAANEDEHAVDGDRQRVGAGNGVADLPHAEFHILRVGDRVCRF